MAYCEPGDVTIGAVMLPRGLNKQDYIDSAADEIDAELGKVYKLPITVTPGSWTGKLLKKVNTFLARGRIVIDSASGGEDTSLNSYGYYHIKIANDTLSQIVSGAIVLPDAEKLDTDNSDMTAPLLIDNRDPASYVDTFYGSDITGQVYPNNVNRFGPLAW